MNERIKELALKAGLGDHLWLDISDSEDVKVTEKFAELLIRECVTSIEKTIDTNCDTDSEKIGCEFAITDLLKHFGIEE
jgi:hypothetical protein